MRRLWVSFSAFAVGAIFSCTGCSSSAGETAAGSGGTGGGPSNAGMAGSTKNLYVDQLRVSAPDEGCLPRGLTVGKTGGPDEGRAACYLGEVRFTTCDCQKPGRAPLSPQLLDLFKSKAQSSQICGAQSGVDCAAACGCEIVQLPGTSRDTTSPLYACQNDVTPPTGFDGFCLIDTDHVDGTTPAPIGNPAIVANCSANAHRRLRFVGQGLPASDAATFIACEGAHL